MIALALAAAAVVASTNLDLRGVFPPEIKTVGVVMPASVLAKGKFDQGITALRAAGYRVKLASRLAFDKQAPVDDRVKDFEEMWLDPEVDLVLCARGGNGSQQLVPKLDWEKLRTRPDQKVLGFSNITILLNAMVKENAGHPISGSSISQLLSAKRETLDWLCRALARKPQPAVKLRALKPGAFSGLPCGGHAFYVMLGNKMKSNPDMTGRVVFLEHNPSTSTKGIKGELAAILKSGCLKGAAGVIFGDITPNNGTPEGVEKMKRDFAARVECPVYDQCPYGHIPLTYALDFRRRLSVDADGTMTWE